MTDKEKIRAEIERLLNKEWEWGSSIEAKFRCEAYRELLEYIDSISEEPVSEDLEEETNRYIDPLTPADIQENPFTSLEKCARHFANWQKEKMMKDVVLETTVIRNDDGCAEDGNYSSWLEYEDYEVIKMPKWAKAGDKVKLIIVREEEI